MNNEIGKSVNEIDELLQKSKKKKFITLIVFFTCIIVAVILVLTKYLGEGNFLKTKAKVTDISVNGNTMNINANRKFMVYDKDPTAKYEEEEPPAKAMNEIDVVFEGVADYSEGKFDGIIKVADNELEGDIVGYSSAKIESEDEEQNFIYSITGMCTNDDGTSPKGAESYSVDISKDLREILIFVFRFNEDDPLIIYSKVE